MTGMDEIDGTFAEQHGFVPNQWAERRIAEIRGFPTWYRSKRRLPPSGCLPGKTGMPEGP